MANVTFSPDNSNRPAPTCWRKLENILLVILIPAATTIIMGAVDDPNKSAKLVLYINTGLVAVIKAVGIMLANGQVYAPAEKGE